MADTTTTEHYPIGTTVSYEDMANPKRSGKIAQVTITRWGIEYDVQWERSGPGEPSSMSSTCTGACWTIG